ncbi:MAG: ORF6N domain-containing protein [Chitinophagales bacterium]
MSEISEKQIGSKIYIIRGVKVMFDSDLAELYQIQTKVLNQAVKRNIHRFPKDFMFQLTEKEYITHLKSQIVTSSVNKLSSNWGGKRKLPYVFTEHGTVMLASVVNSAIAIEVSIQVVRIFIKLRQLLESNKELTDKISKLEEKYDEQFAVVFDAIKQLITQDEAPIERTPIGFKINV